MTTPNLYTTHPDDVVLGIEGRSTYVRRHGGVYRVEGSAQRVMYPFCTAAAWDATTVAKRIRGAEARAARERDRVEQAIREAHRPARRGRA